MEACCSAKRMLKLEFVHVTAGSKSFWLQGPERLMDYKNAVWITTCESRSGSHMHKLKLHITLLYQILWITHH